MGGSPNFIKSLPKFSEFSAATNFPILGLLKRKHHFRTCSNLYLEKDNWLFQCYSGDELLDLYDISGGLSKSDLMSMCPALLQQIASGLCDDTHQDSDEDDQVTDAESKYCRVRL